MNINLFDKETEDNQREQVNISCKVEEQHEEVKEEQQEDEPEEPKEDEPEPEEVKDEKTEEEVKEGPEEEEQKKDKTLSIEELKEILYYYATFNLPWFSFTLCV